MNRGITLKFFVRWWCTVRCAWEVWDTLQNYTPKQQQMREQHTSAARPMEAQHTPRQRPMREQLGSEGWWGRSEAVRQ